MQVPSTSSTHDTNTATPKVNDLEAMDLKWQLSLLSVRAKKYYQRTCKKILINVNDIAGYDKSKVEWCNCHKLGHFSRECRAPKSKESQFRNQDNTRKQGNNEDKSSKAMLAIDGVGFDWSDMAEEQVQKNMALRNSVMICLLSLMNLNLKQLLIKEASKDLDQLLGSQISDKCKKGLGYSKVPPPHPLIYNRPKKLDLSYSGLDEFKEPEFKGYGPENISQDKSSFVESSPNVDKETVFPVNKKVEFTKPKNHEKPIKKSVRYAEMYRSQSPRGNQRNWNGHNKACFICGSFNHLQINYDNHQRRGIVSRNNYNRVDAKTTHPSVHRNMSPKAVLLKTGLTPLNTIRLVNTVHPKTIVDSAKSNIHFSKQAQSTAKRPFYKQTTLTRRSVHTAKRYYYNGRPRAVNTAKSYIGQVNTVRVKGGKTQHDDKGFVDNGCSRHMTENIAYLSDFKESDGGYVAFRRSLQLEVVSFWET
ncbi:hypothetical protein Tco_1462285, partial [Tanacetum coccineum]